MTMLLSSPRRPVPRYQATTKGPEGFCITPSTISCCSTGASTSALAILIAIGTTPTFWNGLGAAPKGPGRTPPVVGGSPSLLASTGSCAAEVLVTDQEEPATARRPGSANP